MPRLIVIFSESTSFGFASFVIIALRISYTILSNHPVTIHVDGFYGSKSTLLRVAVKRDSIESGNLSS
jgi:hypothetical protein